MKRFILGIILSLLLVTGVWAAPFLVCDPQADVETYEVWVDDVLVGTAPAETDGSLRYDLVDFNPDVYTFRAKACTGVWGCSALSVPYVSPLPAGVPINLKGVRSNP